VNPRRRAWLLAAALRASGGAAGLAGATATGTARAAEPADGPVRRGRTLVFPRDHGAHPASRIEWWYLTGWLGEAEVPRQGFQVTFFRSRTGLAADSPSRFAPRQLLFAHAAVTELAAPRHLHAQRIARWSGAEDAALARASMADADIHIGRWRLQRDAPAGREAGYTMDIDGDDFRFTLDARRTQPLLLQGDAGFSRKGPEERQASHYYSEPQLAVQGTLMLDGRTQPVAGRAWLDHEWSDEILHPQAVGWDWIGINLFDGGALTAFQLRRADGSALWAGGSFRPASGGARAFDDAGVRFMPGRRWTSAASAAVYPVQWAVATPAGRFTVRALLDAQELDSRQSTGTVYWEGLSELLDDAGRRVGLGYLEMTGYAGVLRLN
jgi:predicted secreted hydrolase